ncbi:hypothetical protein [Saccharothrix sp. Mg75]|uniref:hypothetical protein n=1 Tax=Saccharothrix sp. Mg75 TaxID=3445357 RepID=UPI003EF00C39
MTADQATPQAVQDFINARDALFRAIDFDHARGVGANEIARAAASAISRPTVLSYLAATRLHTDARDALRAAGLEGPFGIEITGRFGRESRIVLLVLACDPDEIEQDPDTLVARAADALRDAGIDIDRPEQRGSLRDALWDGEALRLRRSRHRAR